MTLSQTSFYAVATVRKRGVMVAVACALLCVLQVTIMPLSVRAASISESFTGSSELVPGMLVSTNPDDESGGITAATIANSNYLFGVVQDGGGALVNFTQDGSSTSVATAGVVMAYATSANGDIKKGDYIGPSWINGVGMRVVEGDDRKALGVALEDFNESEAKDFSGIDIPSGKKTVKVGGLAIRLFGTPAKMLNANQSGVTGFVTKLAGHEVTYVRITIAAVLFISALLLSGVFIKSSIGRSFISLGRNPLASRSIYKSLTQVSVISMAIILLGTAAAYAVVVF